MKRLLYFLTFASLALCFSCGDDESSGSDAELSYDSGENSAPFFGAGVHLAAARFPSTFTSPLVGQNLDRVEFFLVNIPSNCKVQIFEQGTATTAGPMIYEADVTSTVNPDSWNSHTLTEDIAITGNDLWIAIELTHPDERRTIGCDVGPAVANGDWVIEGSQLTWQTYRDFTNNAVDVNWNIRGYTE